MKYPITPKEYKELWDSGKKVIFGETDSKDRLPDTEESWELWSTKRVNGAIQRYVWRAIANR